MHRRGRRGFTLLEMLVTLALVALLATLAAPSFGGMLARHRLKAAAEQVALDLAELRQQAQQRGATLYLNPHAGAQWCYALAVAAGCDCRVPQGCQLKTVRAADHPGVTLLPGEELPVGAQPGRPLEGLLLQGRDGAQLRVGLSALGRPKVCAPSGVVPGFAAC